MGVTFLEVGALIAVFVACIVWATSGKPLSEAPHEDEY